MKYYLIGIKGAGMSALASLLFDLGNEVVGYDDSLEYKFTLEGLNKRGIKVYHDDSFKPSADFIVVTRMPFMKVIKKLQDLKN